MENLKSQVYEYILKNNLIDKEDNLVLAVSGGADSVFMLYILNQINKEYNLNLNMLVCHLNHMIRVEADDDLKYVEEVADSLNLKFFSKKINILELSKEEKRSEEEIGRVERYKFFNEIGRDVFNNNFKICTAHNLNDNTETVLLNLIRGTGIEGLTGINNKTNNIIRPILFLDRKYIEGYLLNNNIKYIIDKTNLESDYTRNSIRNELLPLIKEKYNSNIDETIYRMTDIISDENRLLNDITRHMFESIRISNDLGEELVDSKFIDNLKYDIIKLDLNKFNELDIALRRRILRYIIQEYFNIFKDISKVNIDDAIDLAYNNIGNKYMLLNKNIKLSVLKGIITIEKQ